MTRERVPETNVGITGAQIVGMYNELQRGLRDAGRIPIDAILDAKVTCGLALEIGPGPGYLGLEWLKQTSRTELIGIDISPDMIALASQNAADYGLTDRARYVLGDGRRLPFEDGHFDAVFTAGSLHEWEQPLATFCEIARVLKPGGRYFIDDFRRDMNPFARWFLWLLAKPSAMRAGLVSSINAAYTPRELRAMLDQTPLRGATIVEQTLGLEVIC
jgi:ubiquinone/menaquinone biosynthesis C-methylase UbiE